MISLVTNYIQKRRGEPGLFSFEYTSVTKIDIKFLPLDGPGFRIIHGTLGEKRGKGFQPQMKKMGGGPKLRPSSYNRPIDIHSV